MEELRQGEQASSGESASAFSGLVRGEQGAPQGECGSQKSGAKGPFFITPHAVNRYRERVHRGISYERALGELIEQAWRAHYVKDYHAGQYWRGPKPMRLRLIVAPSTGDELPQVVTVLPAADNMVKR